MKEDQRRDNNKPKKQKCIVCKKIVENPDKKSQICFDCLLIKLIQLSRSSELFKQ